MDKKDYELDFLTNHGNCPVVVLISSDGMNIKENNIVERIADNVQLEFDMCELKVFDWDAMLTPWKVGKCLEGRDFSGRGEELLRKIEGEVIPVINDFYKNHSDIYIAGYSLAGLFALWSLYKSRIFGGAVCCSGSLWYPGWEEFAMNNEPLSKVKIYLSLGDREAKGKNQILKGVGTATEQQYELMKKSAKTESIRFEYNDGGHFKNVDTRIVKGVSHILKS